MRCILRYLVALEHPHALWYALFAAWLAYSAKDFWAIGMVTQDQIDWSRHIFGGASYLRTALDHAQAQGRLFYLLTRPIEYFLAAHPELGFTKLITFLAFILSPWGFSYAFFPCFKERVLFLFVYFSLCWVGLQHLPPAAYPVVNDYPFILLGIGTALIRYSRAWWLVPPVAFLSFMSYEAATAVVLVGFAWAIYSAELPARRKLKLYLGLTAAVLSYALLYLGWRLIFPSAYAGNQFAPLASAKILRTWIAYTLGALPFAAHVPDIVWGDLLIGRAWFHLPSFIFWPNALLAHPLELSFGLLTGWAVLRIYSSSDRSQSEINARVHFLAATAATVAANFPLALSAKYQHLAQHIPSVYLTSRLALLPIAALVTILFGYLFERSRRNFPILGSLSCALLLLALVFSWVFVQRQNRYTAPLLRANLARWDAVAALMACKASGQLSNITNIAIPGIFYSIHVDESDWSGYFAKFAAYRFNQQVKFAVHAPLEENSAHVHFDRLLDGTLNALTIKTESGMHFISKANPETRFLFDRTTHQALAIEAGRGHACGKSGWFIWHFDETPRLSLDTIELVESLPSGEAASVVSYAHLVVPKDEIETAVAALYRLYLGREADPGGLAFWSQETRIAQGNLWRVIKEFEAIKGITSAHADLEAAFQVAAKTCQPLTNQPLSQLASSMPEFARRWRLYALICGKN